MSINASRSTEKAFWQSRLPGNRQYTQVEVVKLREGKEPPSLLDLKQRNNSINPQDSIETGVGRD